MGGGSGGDGFVSVVISRTIFRWAGALSSVRNERYHNNYDDDNKSSNNNDDANSDDYNDNEDSDDDNDDDDDDKKGTRMLIQETEMWQEKSWEDYKIWRPYNRNSACGM